MKKKGKQEGRAQVGNPAGRKNDGDISQRPLRMKGTTVNRKGNSSVLGDQGRMSHRELRKEYKGEKNSARELRRMKRKIGGE